MNLSDATSPEPTPQKKKHSRRRGQFLGVDNLDLSIDSEQEDLVTQNEKLKQEMNFYNVYQLSTYDKVLDLPFLYIANRWRKSQ